MPRVQNITLTKDQLALQSRIAVKNALLPKGEFVAPTDRTEEETRARAYAIECIRDLKPFDFEWQSDVIREEYTQAMDTARGLFNKQLPQLSPFMDLIDNNKMLATLYQAHQM